MPAQFVEGQKTAGSATVTLTMTARRGKPERLIVVDWISVGWTNGATPVTQFYVTGSIFANATLEADWTLFGGSSTAAATTGRDGRVERFPGGLRLGTKVSVDTIALILTMNQTPTTGWLLIGYHYEND